MQARYPAPRAHVRELQPYEPILPLDVLSRRLGIPMDQLIKLDANENPFGTPQHALQSLASLAHAHIYPDPESRELRASLSRRVQLPMENIMAGSGADELIDLTFRLFIDPGDAVLIAPPTFGMYRFDAAVNAARIIEVPRNPDFSLDLPAIRQAVEAYAPKLAFIASPNNPDGGWLMPEDFRALIDLPIVLILDEAYVEFAPLGGSRIREVMAYENLIVLRTFSKYAGLAGLRVGYGAFPSWIISELWKIKQPYNVSVAASAAACSCLDHIEALQTRRDQIVAERERLFEALARVPFLEPYPSQANFILCRVTGRGAKGLKASLEREGILVRYFDSPRLRDHIRISVGAPSQTDALLHALARRE
jgi:histidinol-phosphate aminotransferase